MLKTLAYLLIASLMMNNCSRFFIYAGFEFNQGYIAAKLCENRQKPVLQCKGKCYLKKQLKQAEEKEKKNESRSQKKQQEESLASEPLTSENLAIVLNLQSPAESKIILPEKYFEVYHPPKV